MTFDSFDTRRELAKEQQANLKRAFEIAKDFAKDPQGWLVLMGPYASGKTHLAAAIANYQAEQDTEVLFVTVPDLLDHLRATFAPSSSASYDQRFNEIKTAPLLVLDDLGTESATPWAREKLHQLLNYRYNARLATVITTPHTSGYELEQIDTRLTTRLRDTRISKIFKLTVPAYLGDKQKSLPI
jgi:DNA replication protein DnaC